MYADGVYQQCGTKPRFATSRASGVALVAVLFLVALLSMIAVSVLSTTRMRSQISARQFESIQATETVDSALRQTLIELAAPRDPQSALVSGGRLTRQVALFDEVVAVSVELESGRVDINFSDELTLSAIFIALGFAEDSARTQAQRVIDWRDADDQVTGHGAERAEYERAGLRYGPRNASFESVYELRQVLGLAKLSDADLEAFTVYSHLPTPPNQTSVAAVKQALQWLRARQPDHSAGDTTQESQIAANSDVHLIGEVVRLRGCATKSRSHACRVVIVRFTGNATNPFLVFLWQTDFVGSL